MADAPRVFLSYSHDSDKHADRVLALADALCDGGIDVILDRYVHPAPAEGWPRWMERNLDAADFVLMVCTATYRRRVRGEEEPGQGTGVRWEGTLIYNRIAYGAPGGIRFIPILLPGAESTHIPDPVRGNNHYRIATFDLTDPGYEALYRHLTGQPATPRPDLGPIQILLPIPRPQPTPGPLPPSGGPMTNISGSIVGSAVGAGNTVNAPRYQRVHHPGGGEPRGGPDPDGGDHHGLAPRVGRRPRRPRQAPSNRCPRIRGRTHLLDGRGPLAARRRP